jgi:hypothetical protein
LAVGLAAAVPVVVSTVRALLDGWTPLLDDAIIATHSFDVFSAHSSLVGVFSSSSVLGVGRVYNAGPLLFWLLAVPARLPGNWALPVTMGIVNTASIIGIVALVRRRGGTALMFVTAVAVALMCQSLPQEALHDVRNPESALLPFTLLLFLAWSVACGEYRLLPVTVLVASFVLQSHFSLALPTVVMVAVALTGCAINARHRSRSAASAAERPRRWVVGALAVALVCWSAPLLDQAIHRPGNLVRIVQTATAHQQTLGLTAGWHALVRTIGIPSWWWRSPDFWDIQRSPSAAATASSLVVLVGLAVSALLAVRRRRHEIAALAVLALALSASVAVYTSSTPSRLLLAALVYGVQWCSAVGMFAWLALGWSLAMLAPSAHVIRRRATRIGSALRPRSVVLAAVGVTALVGVFASVNTPPDLSAWIYRPASMLASRLKERLGPHRSLLLLNGSLTVETVESAEELFIRLGLEGGLVYQLRRSGYHPLVQNVFSLVDEFGAYYSGNLPHDETLLIGDSNTRPPRSAREIVSVPIHGVPIAFNQRQPPKALTVWVVTLPSLPGVCGASPPMSAPRRSDYRLRVVPNQVLGFVDHSQITGESVQFCGWAARGTDHRPADSVLVVADGRPVGRARPTMIRTDLVKALGSGAERAGFRVTVPLALLERAGIKRRVQLFGTERGIASPLLVDCTSNPHDFGC